MVYSSQIRTIALYRILPLSLVLLCLARAETKAKQSDMDIAESRLLEYVDWQNQIYSFISKCKDQEGVEALSTILRRELPKIKKMSEEVKDLKFNGQQKSKLGAFENTKAYALYGNRNITTFLDKKNPNLRRQILKLFEPHFETLNSLDKHFTAITETNITGFGYERHSLQLEGVFWAQINTLHKKGKPINQLARAIEFRVFSKAPNDPDQLESMTLFTYRILLVKGLPANKDFSKLIHFDHQKKVVTFRQGKITTSYHLPKERIAGYRELK